MVRYEAEYDGAPPSAGGSIVVTDAYEVAVSAGFGVGDFELEWTFKDPALCLRQGMIRAIPEVMRDWYNLTRTLVDGDWTAQSDSYISAISSRSTPLGKLFSIERLDDILHAQLGMFHIRETDSDVSAVSVYFPNDEQRSAGVASWPKMHAHVFPQYPLEPLAYLVARTNMGSTDSKQWFNVLEEVRATFAVEPAV